MDRRRREPLPPRIHQVPQPRFKPSLLYDRQKPMRQQQIIDPNGDFCLKWNRTFHVTSLVGLFIDPLFLLLILPRIRNSKCMNVEIVPHGLPLTFFRNFVDLLSLVQILMKFRTAFVSRTSRVFGKRELVLDPRKIAIRYLKTDFAIDLVATLPLPQILIWFILPLKKRLTAAHANHAITLVIMLQYVPKLLIKGGMHSHSPSLVVFLGAVCYLMSLARHFSWWKMECKKDGKDCNPLFLDCSYSTIYSIRTSKH